MSGADSENEDRATSCRDPQALRALLGRMAARGLSLGDLADTEPGTDRLTDPFVGHVRNCCSCREILEILEKSGSVADSPGRAARSGIGPVFLKLRPIAENDVPLTLAAASEPARGSIYLEVEDGRFAIRILKNEAGDGSVAYLLDDTGSVLDFHQFTLRVGSREIPFDRSGKAYLPDFPVADMELKVSPS